MANVVVLMGSGSDKPHVDEITKTLDEFGVTHQERVASAHKTPEKVLEILAELEDSDCKVIIAVAGLSNALSGMVAGLSTLPVITCPPYNAEDIWSSLRMPPGIAHETVLDPKNAALAAIKILALDDADLKKKLADFIQSMADKVNNADEKLV
ncbi:MAG: 5-(carboxyamino)imidazole ribonucleotide mutase [Candidatus Micrarchaeota archaeon]